MSGTLRRSAQVEALPPGGGVALRWTTAACEGCGGCGGRCGLFRARDGEREVVAADTLGLETGMAVVAIADAASLRRAAWRGYGRAIVLALGGAAIGHAAGAALGAPNAVAALGLLSGTFLAGRWTKRVTTAPRVVVLPVEDPRPQDPR